MACWRFLVTLILVITPAVQASVVAKIEQIGFPGGLEDPFGANRGLLIRHGVWTPMRFNLRVTGAEHFTGLVRIEQKDHDGDVTYTQIPITLTAGARRGRTFWLYYLPNIRSSREYSVSAKIIQVDDDGAEHSVELLTDKGTPVDRLEVSGTLIPVPTDDRIVLDISTRPVEALRGLTALDKDGESKFRGTFHAARCAAHEIPDTWYGLEMVDFILWDDPDPEALAASSGQFDALIEWVRQGGCLLIGATDKWPALLNTPLGPLLPVTDAEVVQGRTYPGLSSLLGRLSSTLGTDEPVSFCRFKAHPQGRVIPAGGPPTSIFRERQIGHGRVVVIGAELRQALNPKRLANKPPEDVLATLCRISKRVAITPNQYRMPDRRLFSEIKSFVGYRTEVGIRLVVAVLFVVAYIFAATFGSWEWLRRRQQLKHAWSAFAVVAGAASVISIAGVGWVQGLTTRVQQLTIIDGEAGNFAARAHVFFGLKTPTHSDLDVWLPNDWTATGVGPEPTACWLRPSAGLPDEPVIGYAAPGRYQVRPERAAVYGVPVRATLKAFEGYWTGQLAGTLRASLTTKTRTRDPADESGDSNITEFTNDSWIDNGLKVDLADAYLLHAMDIWPGQETGRTGYRRDHNIFIRRLGPILAGQRIDNLADRLYKNAEGVPYKESERGGKDDTTPAAFNLMRVHWSWVGGEVLGILFGGRSEFSGLADHDEGLMLLTTLSEYIGEYTVGTSSPEQTRLLRGDQGRPLDRSALLTPDTALFIGFSEDAGPARIKIRNAGGDDDAWRPVHPRAGETSRRTVYRITLPLNTANRIAAAGDQRNARR